MAEATMAVLRNLQHTVDVMKVEVIEGDEAKPTGKPIYAAGGIKWGPFRDVEERIGKYWIWGSLKPYAAYVFCVFKNLTWNCESQFRYTVPCDGCRNCMSQSTVSSGTSLSTPTRWWHAFIPRTKSFNGMKCIHLLVPSDHNISGS